MRSLHNIPDSDHIPDIFHVFFGYMELADINGPVALALNSMRKFVDLQYSGSN